MASKPTVLFVCVHNAGQSQMAAGWLTHLSGGQVEVRSAGSELADQINPVAVQAMREAGIDITAESPKILTSDAVQDSDVVITKGCGDTCPVFPGRRYEDWDLNDPAGQANRKSAAHPRPDPRPSPGAHHPDPSRPPLTISAGHLTRCKVQ
jgi:arsenate reductase (thioredoxin)